MITPNRIPCSSSSGERGILSCIFETVGSGVVVLFLDPEGSWMLSRCAIPFLDALPSSSLCSTKSIVFLAPDQARNVLMTENMWIIPTRRVDVTAMRGPNMSINDAVGAGCWKVTCNWDVPRGLWPVLLVSGPIVHNSKKIAMQKSMAAHASQTAGNERSTQIFHIMLSDFNWLS